MFIAQNKINQNIYAGAEQMSIKQLVFEKYYFMQAIEKQSTLTYQ